MGLWFDQLATELAEDRVSRRQAIGRVAAGLGAAMIPWAFAEPARGVLSCIPPEKDCLGEFGSMRHHCCKAHERCCTGRSGTNCCRSGEQCCQGLCCGPTEQCASSQGRGLCCPRGHHGCFSLKQWTCCPPGTKCCTSLTGAAQCCTKGEICHHGHCCKPSEICADQCCYGRCCHGHCCAPGEHCCHGNCSARPCAKACRSNKDCPNTNFASDCAGAFIYGYCVKGTCVECPAKGCPPGQECVKGLGCCQATFNNGVGTTCYTINCPDPTGAPCCGSNCVGVINSYCSGAAYMRP